jgi:hypothetical protein
MAEKSGGKPDTISFRPSSFLSVVSVSVPSVFLSSVLRCAGRRHRKSLALQQLLWQGWCPALFPLLGQRFLAVPSSDPPFRAPCASLVRSPVCDHRVLLSSVAFCAGRRRCKFLALQQLLLQGKRSVLCDSLWSVCRPRLVLHTRVRPECVFHSDRSASVVSALGQFVSVAFVCLWLPERHYCKPLALQQLFWQGMCVVSFAVSVVGFCFVLPTRVPTSFALLRAPACNWEKRELECVVCWFMLVCGVLRVFSFSKETKRVVYTR